MNLTSLLCLYIYKGLHGCTGPSSVQRSQTNLPTASIASTTTEPTEIDNYSLPTTVFQHQFPVTDVDRVEIKQPDISDHQWIRNIGLTQFGDRLWRDYANVNATFGVLNPKLEQFWNRVNSVASETYTESSRWIGMHWTAEMLSLLIIAAIALVIIVLNYRHTYPHTGCAPPKKTETTKPKKQVKRISGRSYGSSSSKQGKFKENDERCYLLVPTNEEDSHSVDIEI